MQIDDAFHQAIEDQVFSGAQVIVGCKTDTVFSKSYGKLSQQPNSASVQQNTLFDIASLTKPISTTTLYMMALEEKKISLEDPIQKSLPDFVRQETLTLRHLLSHTSGLPAWLPLFQEMVGKGWGYNQIKQKFIEGISQTKSEAKPGEKRIYSDLGFILLGFALEEIYQRPLTSLFIEKVANPGLPAIRYSPIASAENNIAATEACPWRGKLLQGEVHDDNAYVLGGAAGHAGLFSNAADLEKFLHQILAILTGKGGFVSKTTLEKFIGVGLNQKLGWDMVTPPSQAGTFFSKSTIGHLGFTGCSLWLDLKDYKYFVLLTNRVHPSQQNDQIKQFRPKIHDLLLKSSGLSS